MPVAEKHALPVHVLGDGSVLYKLNTENTVAILTQAVNTHMMGLVLLDTDTGEVLLSKTLPNGGGLPARLLMKEHRIVVHYWNRDASRFDLLSVEMYYDKEDPGPWRLLANAFWGGTTTPKDEETGTGWTSAPLKALTKTFIFGPSGARAIGFTHTSLSITPQSLLVGTSSGRLYAVNHRVISPRRTYPPQLLQRNEFEVGGPKGVKKSTTEHTEEQLPPYHPLIPLVPTDVVSYFYELVHLRGIYSDATPLESTSSVYAFGVDVFSTTTLPAAAAFDLAGELHNPPVLIAILVVAFSIVALTRNLAKEKEAAQRWS